MERIRLIAGLGNVGPEYAGTRHNVGFDTVDLLAGQFGIKLNKEKFGAAFSEVEFQNKKLILLKPLHYMNRSGQAIATATGFYRIDVSQILVVTDDMALLPGMIRLRACGSAGGHNGLADVIEKLGTSNFARLRIGIGKSPFANSRDFVLSKPDTVERELIDSAIAKAGQAVKLWALEGSDETMNKFNTKNGSGEKGSQEQ